MKKYRLTGRLSKARTRPRRGRALFVSGMHFGLELTQNRAREKRGDNHGCKNQAIHIQTNQEGYAPYTAR